MPTFLQNFSDTFGIFKTKIEILEQCKGVHCVDLGESFQTHVYLQKLASIQPRTSPPEFAYMWGSQGREAALSDILRGLEVPEGVVARHGAALPAQDSRSVPWLEE